MRLLQALGRKTEVALWWLFGRPTSQMRREQEEFYEAHPELPKPGTTFL